MEAMSEPVPEQVAQFAQECYAIELIEALLVAMPRLEFELRKVVVQIVVMLLQRSIGSRLPTVDYIMRHPASLFIALRGYEDAEVALNTGIILREMLQHEALAKTLLYSDDFYRFPAYIETTSFGVSCDAFANMKETLVRHRAMAAEYLREHYERFFAAYTQLLDSQNYVTKRQSVKLLAELMVDRNNYAVMMRFVSDENNLKLVMNLLRDRSRNIQYEAFHVFKVFVANPKKTPRVEAILRRNRERLLAYLADFSPERDCENNMLFTL
ncbi:Hym1p [Malassezia cuniculi]|uniref:Hym1p n=1 Tax=Malassezia cuniculi TaxID=948313 RepID=A0AAF0EQM0_9BASI|nr:Hym1p [Malassezia cuniculi]